jgi:DNA repair protein RadD
MVFARTPGFEHDLSQNARPSRARGQTPIAHMNITETDVNSGTLRCPSKPDPAPAVIWRGYQRRAVNAAVLALKAGKAALLVLPTGSGKGLNAADAARRAHAAGMRTLIVAPTRELVQQDADAVAFVTGKTVTSSFACAGLGPVDLDGDVVIGTPQTLVRRLAELGHIDLQIIDEAHRLGRRASGQIHRIVTELRSRDPKLMLLGLTATPFRLDSGRLTEGEDRLFDEVAFEVGYSELVAGKYLAPLIGPKDTIERLDVAGLRIAGGDYSASDLARFDRSELTYRIVDQIVAHGAERKSWLVFAVSIDHAGHLTEALVERGIDARLLTGRTPKNERKELVADFKASRAHCLVGCDVFSTGFDAPAVDLIAVVRPTASPVSHVQSAGRGTRPAPDKGNCLVLDFAGNFARLGPIDAPYIRQKGERARGTDDEPLTRCCPNCDAIIAVRAKRCLVCDAIIVAHSEWRTDTLSTNAANHSIITGAGTFTVLGVHYRAHEKAGRPDSLRIIYHVAGYRFPTVSEWLCCWHGGHAGLQARQDWRLRVRPGAPITIPDNATEAAAIAAPLLRTPVHVAIAPQGEFIKVIPVFDERTQ